MVSTYDKISSGAQVSSTDFPTWDLGTKDLNACLKAFIFLFSCGFPVEGLYDGDHVLTRIDYDYYDERGLLGIEAPGNRYLPLEEYGYDHLIHSFTHLTMRERKLLRIYLDSRG